METCTSTSAIELVAVAVGFLAAVLWLDMVWVRSCSDPDDTAAFLRRRGWLNAFVGMGGVGAAVLLWVWISACTPGAL